MALPNSSVHPLHSYFKHSAHRGYSVPPGHAPEGYATVETLSSRPDDVIIATYPKSGTTWIQTMVYHLMICPAGPLTDLDRQIPWLQSTKPGMEALLDELPSPRIFKTHDYHSWLPSARWANKKTIYCYRNPKDIVVSYYHHLESFKDRNGCEIVARGDFPEYFSKIARDRRVCMYGLWEDHVMEWLAQAGAGKILFLTYEDLVEDTERELKKIAEFLGVELTEELKKQVLHEGKFETMQKNPVVNNSSNGIDVKTTPFIRKGNVGGWRDYLTGEQSTELDKAIAKVHTVGGRVRCTLENN